MNTWVSIWGIMIVAAFGTFAVLAIAVTVGGIFDIFAMFRTLNMQHKHPSNHETDD